MFCVLPIFHEREMHLLNLEASDSFKDNFMWVSKIIINICTVVVFIIPQYKITNFYWFIYLIRTFTENAFYIYALELIWQKSTLLLVKLKIFLPMKPLEFNPLLLKFEIMKKIPNTVEIWYFKFLWRVLHLWEDWACGGLVTLSSN